LTPNEPGSDAVREPNASWHFDALSDDGGEMLAISFYKNYPYSSRRFRKGERIMLPAVSFTYWNNGELLLRAVKTIAIANSSLKKAEADYGSGIIASIDLLTPGRCRIVAEIEWLAIETEDAESCDKNGTPEMSTQRSDVSGRITLLERKAGAEKTFHFRGTGSNEMRNDVDPNRASGTHASGTIHLAHITATFRVVVGSDQAELVISRNGEAKNITANAEIADLRRDRYGMKIPQCLAFSAEGIELIVEPQATVQSGFFEVKTLAECSLSFLDEEVRKVKGLVTFSMPSRARNPAMRWISSLRVGKNGRAPLF
jgi:hypothetical protein